MTEGTKYHPLFEHLLFGGRGEISMTFKEIEDVLGKPLPPSARKLEEWWSNNARGHSQARAWLRANYKTARVDLARETVDFKLDGWPDGYVKAKWPPVESRLVEGGLSESAQSRYTAPEPRSHPLFGVWAGKVKLLPGVDYTKPAFDMDESA